MSYHYPDIQTTADTLLSRLKTLEHPQDIFKAPELRALFEQLKNLPAAQRPAFGNEVNDLRESLQTALKAVQAPTRVLPTIDVTAPFGNNLPTEQRPQLLPTEYGGMHPLMRELQVVLDIFYGMGFTAVESREIDDDFHMFGALNFPEDHPARDDYDTFMTEQTDGGGKQLIAPAHTSSMQHRILLAGQAQLALGQPIAAVIPGRVFRNEDLDPRHEHTFYQIEGVYVDRGVNAGHLIATLKTFLEAYFETSLEVKTQPFYFPFTEPSFEFTLSCPFCQKQGCAICSYSGWIELLGCGMVHPNVLHAADIDTNIYTGFAWGMGIERLVMMKYGIEDIRYFESARLDFLRQFA
jgi:phenylalanyl-tRNA synthetase alpha chain